MLGIVGLASVQDNAAQQPSAGEQLQHIHTPQSIDHELARLTRDLQLSREPQPVTAINSHSSSSVLILYRSSISR